MRKLFAISVLCLCCLSACSSASGGEQASEQHEHKPDNANCRTAQYCVECGEQLAERGEHTYPKTPNEQVDGYSIYTCQVCGYTEIINQDGFPVVPIE